MSFGALPKLLTNLETTMKVTTSTDIKKRTVFALSTRELLKILCKELHIPTTINVMVSGEYVTNDAEILIELEEFEHSATPFTEIKLK